MSACFKHPRRNFHHLRPRTRGGTNEAHNLLLLRIERHAAYHTLFGLRTLTEAIKLLKRIQRMKGRKGCDSS